MCIRDRGLDENIGKGRIYRLVHKDFKAGPQPKMLDETTKELVAHLSHPNGWWRDTAQRMIILRDDRESVVSLLEGLVQNGSSELGRLHALWALEGMDKVRASVLAAALKDEASIVRTSAIRVAEPFMAAEDETVIAALTDSLPKDAEMVVQMLNSLTASATTHAELLALGGQLEKGYGSSEIVKAVLKARADMAGDRSLALEQKKKGVQFAKAMTHGKEIYQQLCHACHGTDGQGTPMVGVADAKLAPSFTGSPRVLGSGESGVRVMLHGLTGPIDGKKYEGLMVSMGANDDQWIADVLTYVRNSFGNEAPMIEPKMVAALRKKHSSRKEAWTAEELAKLESAELPYQRSWKLKASHNLRELRNAFDGDNGTRYTTKTKMEDGMWVQIQFPRTTQVNGLILDTASSNRDYPRGYTVTVSDNGKDWGQPIAAGQGEPLLEITFPPVETKYIRVNQTGTNKFFWSIHEMKVIGKEL